MVPDIRTETRRVHQRQIRGCGSLDQLVVECRGGRRGETRACAHLADRVALQPDPDQRPFTDAHSQELLCETLTGRAAEASPVRARQAFATE